MTVSEKIKEVCQKQDFEKALEVAQFLNVPLKIIQLANSRNKNHLFEWLKNQLINPKLFLETWKGEGEKEKEVKVKSDFVVIVKEAKEHEIIVHSDTEFPLHYPRILQHKLIEANKLIAKKRALSNKLREKIPQPQPELVKEILTLGKKIDEIYSVKKDFDKTERLPADWVSFKDKEVENEEHQWMREIQNARSRISKRKAKLYNPTENKTLDVKELRKEIAEDEELIARLQTKLDLKRKKYFKN